MTQRKSVDVSPFFGNPCGGFSKWWTRHLKGDSPPPLKKKKRRGTHVGWWHSNPRPSSCTCRPWRTQESESPRERAWRGASEHQLKTRADLAGLRKKNGNHLKHSCFFHPKDLQGNVQVYNVRIPVWGLIDFPGLPPFLPLVPCKYLSTVGRFPQCSSHVRDRLINTHSDDPGSPWKVSGFGCIL